MLVYVAALFLIVLLQFYGVACGLSCRMFYSVVWNVLQIFVKSNCVCLFLLSKVGY